MRPTLETLTAHIRERLADNPSPAQIAAHFGMSRFALSRWFRAQKGLALRDYIAALKIEQGIAPLVQGQPVIESQLEAGHSSAATYSHRFRAHTGLAPSEYRERVLELHQTMSGELADLQARVLIHQEYRPHPQTHALTVHIEGASSRSAVFVGLYPEPIPRGNPVVGLALFRTRQCLIDTVPDGSYHLLACEITPSLNPLHYFRLDHCLRAKHPEPIAFPLPAPQTVHMPLRPLLPSDPPITSNMPKLLFDQLARLRASRNP